MFLPAYMGSFEADKRDFGFMFLPSYMGSFEADKRDFGFMFMPAYMGCFEGGRSLASHLCLLIWSVSKLKEEILASNFQWSILKLAWELLPTWIFNFGEKNEFITYTDSFSAVEGMRVKNLLNQNHQTFLQPPQKIINLNLNNHGMDPFAYRHFWIRKIKQTCKSSLLIERGSTFKCCW